MGPKTLVPDADVVHLEALVADDRGITVVVTTTGDTAVCPDCTQPSTHLHSRRRRVVADLPWQGLAVRLDVRLRRFSCRTANCSRGTFTERVPTVVAPYARRTARLADLVRAVALALGGEGGARLLAALGLHASPDALLDAIRAATRPAIPAPRAIGIDDWSWRRGHRFGTIIVDLERHAVVDLLPDRAVASTAAWLREHPQVAVIARDRGGVYAEAAATGAPRAMQVADRWHLMHNLAEVLEELLLHKRAALRDAASAALPSEADPDGADPPAAMVATGATAGTAEHTPGPLTPGRPRRGQECLAEARRLRQERLVGQYQAIRRLHAAGADVADIARRVGTSRRTVYRYRNLPRQILFHHPILCRRASPRPRPATPNTRPTRRSIAVGHVRQPSCRTRRSPDWLGGEARCDGAVAPQGGERNRAYGPTRAGMAC